MSILHRIRTYRKQELAALYFPHAAPRIAVHHLMRWINRCPPLLAELEACHYRRHAKVFTARQVALIFRHLEEP